MEPEDVGTFTVDEPVTYTVDAPESVDPEPVDPEPVEPAVDAKPKAKRARRAEPAPVPESDVVLVSGGPMWARGTFVKNGIVLHFDEDGYAATDHATADAVVSQHREFRVV